MREKHNRMVAAILSDPETSENDRYVARVMLENAVVSAEGVLPFCQDTGTAACLAHKGEQVLTGSDDAALITEGIYEAYRNNCFRYSQMAPLTMYEEINTKTNLPAQIDIMAVPGNEYTFLFVAKGGGSANKSALFPGNQGPVTSGQADCLLHGKNEESRHGGLPSLPHRLCHRAEPARKPA